MSGTLVCLIDFLGTRTSCPVCGAGRRATDLPTQWAAHRAMFTCEAEFAARGEAIIAERACSDRSKIAAVFWTKEATGYAKPAPQDEGDGA
ncbi:hypothetical protein [Rhizobium wuzhouense]|uniref:Uncharacterized protein n=1 Tax=Rhizobium wuzhouense TaxID=1986026 RepID=A0ABX5NPU1_9HYPH|nr:hypothetical protein [Rhizobium wuzhouense]PYB71287.1 hypothetical protein DMY87_18185 [Rhizobium wuzhouense]